jgi:hypothetical protein
LALNRRKLKLKIRFRPGDFVEVLKTPPGADRYTPAPGTICLVAAVDYRRGNRHPVLAVAVSDKTRLDWMPDNCLAAAWWWKQPAAERQEE